MLQLNHAFSAFNVLHLRIADLVRTINESLGSSSNDGPLLTLTLFIASEILIYEGINMKNEALSRHNMIFIYIKNTFKISIMCSFFNKICFLMHYVNYVYPNRIFSNIK